jgi:hypothetical protein
MEIHQIAKFNNCGLRSDFIKIRLAFVIIKFSDYYGAFDINSEAVYINSGIWIGFSHLEAKYIQVSFLTSYSHIEAQVIHIMFIFHLALFIIF